MHQQRSPFSEMCWLLRGHASCIRGEGRQTPHQRGLSASICTSQKSVSASCPHKLEQRQSERYCIRSASRPHMDLDKTPGCWGGGTSLPQKAGQRHHQKAAERKLSRTNGKLTMDCLPADTPFAPAKLVTPMLSNVSWNGSVKFFFKRFINVVPSMLT